MPFQIYNGSAWVDPTTIKRSDGSTWVDVQNIYKSDGSTWTLVWSRVSVNINNRTIGDFTAGNGSGFATYRLAASGQASDITQSSGTFNISGEWLTAGSASACEARVTVQSGTLSSGTTGTWVNLGTTRDWTLSRNSVGTSNCTILVEIRNAATLQVLDSATITLQVIVDPE